MSDPIARMRADARAIYDAAVAGADAGRPSASRGRRCTSTRTNVLDLYLFLGCPGI